MSEEEFLDWCDDETLAEWVDGEVQLMSPVTLDHDRIVKFLNVLLIMYVEAHDLGEVRGEPYQIRLTEIRRRRLPDLFFVSTANVERLSKLHFQGGPDLVVEVISPESQSRDRREKYHEYQAAGVREYWIVDPLGRQVELHLLGSTGTFSPAAETDGQLSSTVLAGFYIRPEWLWQLPLPKVADVLREIESFPH